MKSFEIKTSGRSIEEAMGSGKVDFANKFIGGGALRTGCVQEEIMFVTHPELLVTILLCEKLTDN
jgi:poly(ADP-ribose) glycohydrolase